MNCFQYYWNDTNLDEKLKDALLSRCFRLKQPYAEKAEARWLVERKDTFSYKNKKFSDLLCDLKNWLVDVRPDLLAEFNEPVEQAEFDQFGQETGLILPNEYKLLLAWRGGQLHHFEDGFDPFSEETLMSLLATKDNRECMNGLMEKGSLPKGHWDPYWLPFTADGFGNHTCVDLTPETYGEVLLYNRVIGGRISLCENMTEWLAELVDKMNFLVEDFMESESAD